MAGVIIGRFMPPHNGHLYLIDFARHMVDRLYVLVCTLSHEPIPGDLRYRWVRELAPSCEIVHITEEIPAARRGEAGAIAIWAQAVKDAVPETITRVFASENYGWELAWHLDAQYVPVDPSRSNIPVSASAIRTSPYENWRFIPPPVRPWYLRHVAIIGMRDRAVQLADELETVVAHPYREFWQFTWNEFAGRRTAQPLSEEQIRDGEAATITALSRHANRILVHDLRSSADLSRMPRVDLIVAPPDHQDIAAGDLPAGQLMPLVLTPDQAGGEEVARMLLQAP